MTWNAAAERLYGYSAVEARGQPLAILVPPERADEEPRILERIGRGERIEHYETMRMRKDRQLIQVSLTLSPIRDQYGQIVAISHIARDITERRRAEEALRQSEQRLRLAQQAAGVGAFEWNIQTGANTWTPELEALYGLPPGGFAGTQQAWEELVHPEDRGATVRLVRRALEALAPIEGEWRVIWPDGSLHWLAGRCQVFADASGTPQRMTGVNLDITARKQHEERLRESQKLESLGLLAGGVAHDFNNLLTRIMGNASLMLESTRPSSPDRVVLQEIMQASTAAADLTRQLLAYAGKARFVVESIDLSQTMRDISALVRTSISRKVQLRFDLSDNLPPVQADTAQIQQLLMNLVINAGEAIGDNVGSILVTMQQQEVDDAYIEAYFALGELTPGIYVVLEVHDTGPGMDEATRLKIFDPFFTTKKTGRGLGLSAVQGIVRGHKGAMRVYSALGKGTTFKVLLPASSLLFTQREAVAEAVQLPGSGTILIVDDEDEVRKVLTRIIERLGYSVITAADGAEALEIVSKQGDQIDLVILDLTMPVMSGEETVRELRRMRPDMPVLLSSGFNESEAIRKLAGKGLAGFVQKPYTARQVTQKIAQALAQRHP